MFLETVQHLTMTGIPSVLLLCVHKFFFYVLLYRGAVVTLECVEKLLKMDMTDPISGDKMTEKDIIVVQRVCGISLNPPLPSFSPFFFIFLQEVINDQSINKTLKPFNN